MELLQFAFVLAVCIALAAVVYSTLQGSFKPGLVYISHLSEGAWTTKTVQDPDTGEKRTEGDFDMYMSK